MAKGLNVLITQGDQELNDINLVFNGSQHLENTRLRSSIDLSRFSGGKTMPLILLGHANLGRFKESNSSRLRGSEVITLLHRRGLNFASYSFIFLAGCDGAAGPLYEDIAKAGQLPTLAATTKVQMTKLGGVGHVTFAPIAGGEWKIYQPDTGLELSLGDPSCQWYQHPLTMMDITLL
ncbi:MAG: hypothetical protein R3F53_00645 [Gammaproteobacteria bacterium]